MLRLMLLRHAKSSWDDSALADRDRPLTKRGARAAQAIGRLMAARRLIPDLVLCSPARRARDTWDLIAAEFVATPRLVIDEAIYDFGDGGRLLEAIAERAGDAASVLVIGHNPALEQLALRLIRSGDKKLRSRLERKYPTAAIAIIDFNAANWPAIGDLGGELSHFVRPKDLLEEVED